MSWDLTGILGAQTLHALPLILTKRARGNAKTKGDSARSVGDACTLIIRKKMKKIVGKASKR